MKEDKTITFADTEAGGEICEQDEAEYEAAKKRIEKRARDDKEAILAIMAVLSAKHYSVDKACDILDGVKWNIKANTEVVDPVAVINKITPF